MSAVTEHFEEGRAYNRRKVGRRVIALRISADWLEANIDALALADVGDLRYALLGSGNDDSFDIYCYRHEARVPETVAQNIMRQVGGSWTKMLPLDGVRGYKMNIVDEKDPFWIRLVLSQD